MDAPILDNLTLTLESEDYRVGSLAEYRCSNENSRYTDTDLTYRAECHPGGTSPEWSTALTMACQCKTYIK